LLRAKRQRTAPGDACRASDAKQGQAGHAYFGKPFQEPLLLAAISGLLDTVG
jgi:hypothetical protein